MTDKNSIKVLVTGAAGNIAQSLLPLICNGLVFGADTRVTLHLLEIPRALQCLRGIKMEIEDGAYRLIDNVLVTDDNEEACKDIDWAILIGGFSVKDSWKKFERDQLLDGNVPIFSKIGDAIEKNAKRTIKVVVVANPANTNALITMMHAKSIPKENFTALSRLDYNRGISELARRLGVQNDKVKNLAIWGNHSRTLIGDASRATVDGADLTKKLNDDAFLQNEFIEFLRDRFHQIIEYKGSTSTMSAANAVKDHIHDWVFGTKDGEHVAMCVISDGNPYGIAEGLISSFPVTISDGKWRFAEGFEFSDQMKKMIRETEEQMLNEKKIAVEKIAQ